MNSNQTGPGPDERCLVIAGALTPPDWILRERFVDALERAQARWLERDPAATARARRMAARPVLDASVLDDRPGEDQGMGLVPRTLSHDRYLTTLTQAAGTGPAPRWSAMRTLSGADARVMTASPRPATPWRWALTPAHFHFAGDHVRYVDGATDDLTAAQARELVHAVQPLFAESGRQLILLAATQWAVDESAVPEGLRWQLDCATRDAVAGRPVDAYLPEGRDARAFRALLNEVQMTWHDHPVNAQREAAGLAPVNAFWLDGPVDQASLTAWQALTGSGRVELDDTLLGARLVDDPALFIERLPAVIDRVMESVAGAARDRRCVACGDLRAVQWESVSAWRNQVRRLASMADMPSPAQLARRLRNRGTPAGHDSAGRGAAAGRGAEAGRRAATGRGLFAPASWIEEPIA